MNKILAIPAAVPAMPVKPNTADIIATTKKVTAQFNIYASHKNIVFTRQQLLYRLSDRESIAWFIKKRYDSHHRSLLDKDKIDSAFYEQDHADYVCASL